MQLVSNAGKILVLLYAAYFLIGSLLAPLFAHWHYFPEADFLYAAFSAACQQQPSRTFWMVGYPMALCARCIGVYTGFILFGSSLLYKSFKIQKRLLFLLFLPASLEKLMEWFLWDGTNTLRFLSGLCLGSALLASFILISQFIWRQWNNNEFKKIFLHTR